MDERVKYSFGYGEKDAVECPEMDAFIADVRATFARHGVGIELEHDYDDRSKIVLVPFERDDFSWITDQLREYGSGIPWLDEARERFRQNGERRRRVEAQVEAGKRTALKAAKDAAKQAQINAALEHGIELAGKKYRLVES